MKGKSADALLARVGHRATSERIGQAKRGISTAPQPLLTSDRRLPKEVCRHNQGAAFPGGVLALFARCGGEG